MNKNIRWTNVVVEVEMMVPVEVDAEGNGKFIVEQVIEAVKHGNWFNVRNVQVLHISDEVVASDERTTV